MKSYPKNGRVYFHTENDMIKKLDNPEENEPNDLERIRGFQHLRGEEASFQKERIKKDKTAWVKNLLD